MPRKEDRWQNIEEILSFWDNENQIEEEILQRKGLLRKTIFAVVVALLVVVGISAWCVSRKREVTFADEYGSRAFRECNQLMVADIPDEVTSIDNMAFWGSIRIPRNVHEIGQFCLMECNSLKDVYDEAQEPQRVVKLFGKATASHVTLHVPAISLEAYKNAECWNEVKCIVPTPGKFLPATFST